MTTFTIDTDNNITAYKSTDEARQSEAAGVFQFDSQAALAKVSADWPLSRFIVGAGGDGRQFGLRAGPAREGIADGILADVQPGLDAKVFHEPASAQIGFRKDHARYDGRRLGAELRWIGFC